MKNKNKQTKFPVVSLSAARRDWDYAARQVGSAVRCPGSRRRSKTKETRQTAETPRRPG